MTPHVVTVWHRRDRNVWHAECPCGQHLDDHDRNAVEAFMAECRAQATSPKKPPKENEE